MEEFEDIRITGLDAASTELPGDSALRAGQVRFFFRLSEKPSNDWKFQFGELWNEAGNTEKAVIADDGVWVWWSLSDAVACAEVLKKAVASTNDWYRAALKEQEEEEQAEADAETALRQQIEDLAKTLKFD